MDPSWMRNKEFRCSACDHLVEFDPYEEAWYHIYNGHYTCDRLEVTKTDEFAPKAMPAYVIEEMPG